MVLTSAPPPATVIAQWRIGQVHKIHRVATGMMNKNWRVDTDTGSYVLKLFLDVRGPQLAFQIRVLRALAAVGVPVPLPVLTQHNTDTILIAGHEYGVYPWVTGVHRSGLSMTMERCAELGATLGRIHGTLRRTLPTPPHPYQASAAPTVQALTNIDRLLDVVDSRNGNTDFDRLAERTLRMKRGMLLRLADRYPPQIPTTMAGYVHGDFHPHNVLLDRTDDVIAVLDWDRLRIGPYARELVRAATFFFTYGDERGFDLERAQTFVAGYRRVFDIGAPAIADGVHRLWWERLTENWIVEWHYLRKNPASDHLLAGQAALLQWWTARYDEVMNALTV